MGIFDLFKNNKVLHIAENENLALINAWKEIINSDDKSWVLFENGTCVILMQPELDLEQQAKELLSKYGKVMISSSSADFSVITLNNGKGWIVTSHHPDILTIVLKDEFNKNYDDLSIGLEGRSCRNWDAEKLNILHIEDIRSL
ncbi:hypothetical protein [Actinobacillus porcinus]|uniref:hypothetical protein n=1 Tax=Actinobacillus porcinus TaxID=51048 RepID=UPI002A90FA54|nr:hypothetical protein [Actinobacillus porcinus]MDY6217016.1 hypothetical protein [Actinobacillus porcinus]